MPKRDHEARWRKRLERWRRSGGTVAEFCRAEGVSKATFYSWRRRLGDEPAKAVQFVEVGSMAAASTAPIELDVGGVIVRLRSGFKVDDLEAVVAVLGERR